VKFQSLALSSNKHKENSLSEGSTMQIQQTYNLPTPKNLPQTPPPEKPQAPDPWTSVTFDSKDNCYHYEKPGYHRSVSINNPLKEGLTAAALIGVPSAVGAAEHLLLGGLGATGITAMISPAFGAVLGGTWAGVASYKGSNNNPMYAGLGALAGAGVGAVAWPLLKLPGVWGGVGGAAAAAGALGAGVAIWAAVSNHKKHQEALAAGYKPQA
jgi:hypothetical protein